MKKMILCFSSERILQGSFFVQISKALQFRYEIKKRKDFQTGGKTEDETIVCYFISDVNSGSMLNFLSHFIMNYKRDRFVKRFIKNNEESSSKPVGKAIQIGEYGSGSNKNVVWSMVSVYYMADQSDYPPDVRRLCTAEFLHCIPLKKNSVIGIIDGDALNYKVWIKLLRERLDSINGLLIVSDRPESFTEFRRDAWEQQGLIVTITKHETELQFCDIIVDCSDEIPTKGYCFRKPCSYFMPHVCKKKKRQLIKHNPQIRLVGCEDFAC